MFSPSLPRAGSRLSSIPLRAAALAGAALLAAAALAPSVAQAQSPFSQFVIFGDSLSDTGNHADRSTAQTNVRFPTDFFRYTDGRYTSGPDLARFRVVYSHTFRGLWHEQLSRIFFNQDPARPSLEGGTDYAYGDARTTAGTHDNVISAVGPLVRGGIYDVTIDDMGKQVNDYLSAVGGQADPKALYILWGANNDLASANPTPAGVAAAVANEVGQIQQLAIAGARNFFVYNVPPLGDTPVVAALGAATAAGANQLAAGFDANIGPAIAQLQAGLAAAAGINIKVTIADSFTLLRLAEANPRAYGFDNVNGFGQQAGPRDDADRFLFWDGFHPTAAGHYQLAVEAFSDLTGTPVVQLGTSADASSNPTLYFTRSGNDVSGDLTVRYTQTGSGSRSVVIPAGQRTVTVTGVLPTGVRRGRTIRFELVADAAYAIGVVAFRDVLIK
ncbi:MAG: SGNH/GDSL hydrolase family protein [Verrucomicrobia bacterium]|nr:SGNH/GDSL hydrolase family protein [Verrucomicrobiota bacterium]